jgi:hypothetical protein
MRSGDHLAMKPFALTQQNLPYLVQKLERLDKTHQWEVIVRERKSQRSLDQNSRLWDLYTALGDYIGEDKDKIHELMGWKFLRQQKLIAGIPVEVIESTTKLNTKRMAEYQEAIERWAADIGFVWDEAA